jgi:hypothetical protein
MDWMNKLAESKYPIYKKDCRLTVRQKEGKRAEYIKRLSEMLKTMTQNEIITKENRTD